MLFMVYLWHIPLLEKGAEQYCCTLTLTTISTLSKTSYRWLVEHLDDRPVYRCWYGFWFDLGIRHVCLSKMSFLVSVVLMHAYATQPKLVNHVNDIVISPRDWFVLLLRLRPCHYISNWSSPYNSNMSKIKSQKLSYCLFRILLP